MDRAFITCAVLSAVAIPAVLSYRTPEQAEETPPVTDTGAAKPLLSESGEVFTDESSVQFILENQQNIQQ